MPESVKKSLSQEAWFQALLRSTGDGLIAISSQGEMFTFNPAAERMFGWTESEALGKNVRMLMASPDREMHDAYLQRYLRTGERRIIGREREVTGLRKDGSILPIGLMVSELEVGNERFFLGIVRDITERKAIEAELDRYRNRLEDLVSQRTKELERSYEQLRAAEKMASIGELSAKIAHEIKNPLTGISAALQLLAKGVPKGDGKREIFDNVLHEVRRLDDTVQDLLRYARPLPPKLSPGDLRSLVRDVLEPLKLHPEVKKHRLVVDIPEVLIVRMDPKLMEQALINLVLNASQAMAKPGTIRMKARKEGNMARLEIADSGPGIPEGELDQIFEPFFTTKSKGTGLGLPITKKNIEAHGGSIKVKNGEQGGACFCIQLPLDR